MTIDIQAITVSTSNRRHGTVTLTETATGWSIDGWHKTRLVAGLPGLYRFTVKRCDCDVKAQAEYDAKTRQGGYAAAYAVRPTPICTDQPGHTGDPKHRREYSHCHSYGHDVKVLALFEQVAKSYDTVPRLSSSKALAAVAGTPNVKALKYERAQYLTWLAANDPTADNPYATKP